MSDWRPIKNAPTDGSRVLLASASRDDGMAVGYWDMYYSQDGYGYSGGDGWVVDSSGEEYYTLYERPTHWMPLPLPPTVRPNDGT